MIWGDFRDFGDNFKPISLIPVIAPNLGSDCALRITLPRGHF